MFNIKKLIITTILSMLFIISFLIIIVTLIEKIGNGYQINLSNLKLFTFNYLNEFQFVLFTSFISIITSIFTIISIILAFYQWKIRDYHKNRSHVNALLEEIRNNRNLLDNQFISYNEDELFKIIKSDLINYKQSNIYPLMINLEREKYSKIITKQSFRNINFFPLFNAYISNACSTENFFSLRYPRIFLNLGHLNFSILRHNQYIEKYNNISGFESSTKISSYEIIQNEYITWLFLRINFVLIDLISTVEIKYFIDKEYVQSIKNKI